jgi:alkylation response protein AidB-like acyl-CoA dehydrogenase
MSELPSEAADLVKRIEALLPLLTEEAAAAEQQRQLTDRAIQAIEASGVFGMMVPRVHGGLELDLDAFVEVGLAIAKADISTAWVTTFLIEHNWILCQYPESFQRALFADRPYVLAPGAIAPTGRAKRVDGGYRVSGRWAWGTGVMHSSWIMVGALEQDDPASMRFFACPKQDITVEDTWFTDGMCATGSNDMVFEDVFIPEERAVSTLDLSTGRAPGSQQHAGALYRTPMAPILMLAASMPLVGHASEVARQYRARLEGQVRMLVTKSAERPAYQARLARVSIEAEQAERLLRDVAADVMRLRDSAELVDRGRWAASLTHAVHQAREVIDSVGVAAGASAHFSKDPLQRARRDINMATCHVAFDLDNQLELYGRLLLGFEPKAGLF